MAVNGKQKGNGFERKIANTFSERFKEYTGLEQSFRRNVDSGSFFGGKNQIRTQTHDTSKASFGDMVVPNGFRFSVECKFYKTPPSFASLIKQDIKQWDGWLEQANQDCVNSDTQMALIIKYNNVEELVLLNKEFLLNEIKVLSDLTIHQWANALSYKQYAVITLKQFLSLSDSVFFNKTQ